MVVMYHMDYAQVYYDYQKEKCQSLLSLVSLSERLTYSDEHDISCMLFSLLEMSTYSF